MKGVGTLPPTISEEACGSLDNPVSPCDAILSPETFAWGKCSSDTAGFPPAITASGLTVTGSDVGELHCGGQRDDPGASSSQLAFALSYLTPNGTGKQLHVSSCTISGCGTSVAVSVKNSLLGANPVTIYSAHKLNGDECGVGEDLIVGTDISTDLPLCCPTLVTVNYSPAGAYAPSSIEVVLEIV